MRFIIFIALLYPVASFAIDRCNSSPRHTCVVDGDTIWLNGEKIRLAGYDSPEPTHNICGGEREVALAHQATDRLIEILNSGTITVEPEGEDFFRRTVALVRVNGQDVAPQMVAEGLGRVWPDGVEFWCE
jgi:endonuclease YncB( thermonuclease family)